MKVSNRSARLIAITTASWLALNINLLCQVKGTLFQRVSKLSNFEFAIDNDGTLWGKNYPEFGNPFAPRIGFWPRNSFHMQPGGDGGLLFLAKKNGRYLSSDAGYIEPIAKLINGVSQDDPFYHMVPGRIGDPKAGYNSTFGGMGWRYIDEPDYVVYSSLDYNSDGVDISGNNYNDWPIRVVNGGVKYVANPLHRPGYPPVYRSDEEMFLIFKDTDTGVDEHYSGPNGWSVPIGIEVHNYVYTWGGAVGKNIVVFRYDVINKSGTLLDSCFIVFGSGLRITDPQGTALPVLLWNARSQPWRNLMYAQPTHLDLWATFWKAPEGPPILGFPFLETPKGYQGNQVGLSYGLDAGDVQFYVGPDSQQTLLQYVSDSLRYVTLARPKWWWLSSSADSTKRNSPWPSSEIPVIISGPFPVQPNDTARFAVAYIFSDDYAGLLLMDDYVQKIYVNDLKGPFPPPAPKLSARSLDRSVKLSWDNSAESAVDPIIPDSLGRPFYGYRLLRARSKAGPYTEIGRWTIDSIIVHEYLDKGTDIGGLKNNVQYYYQLLSFDEGAKFLKLDPMESKAVDGVNAQSVVPSTEPSNAASQGSGGSLLSGTLGDVSAPKFVPLSPTNFNNLISGQTVQVKLSATTDGIKYYLPVTFNDSLSGRLENDVIDPNLFVDGSPSIAGIKAGEGVIHDLFGIGATDIHVPYSFEQLSERYHIVPTIEAPSGADVPIILDDSLKFTGINTYSPYTSAAREVIVEFTSSGIDTASTFFLRYMPYLNVTVTDVATGLPATDWQMNSIGTKLSTGLQYNAKPNRYYLSGTLSNGDQWEFGSWLSMYQSKVAFDLTDRGVGSGKTGVLFPWGSSHRTGTRDFQVGDRVRIKWQGGVKATFPQAAVLALVGAPGTRTEVTGTMMEKIRIVPNPYLVRHEAQQSGRQLYFNYLPEECTIRIYTIALDLVKTIHHQGGSREVWDLQTEGGQIVASQMLYAYIESANGAKTIKKFSVIVGK